MLNYKGIFSAWRLLKYPCDRSQGNSVKMGSKPDIFNITRQHSVLLNYYFLKIILTFFFSEKYSLGIKIKIKPILKVILLRILLFKFIETKKGKKIANLQKVI